MKELLDCELVSLYIRGSENALSVLLERHKQKVYDFIYNKVYNVELTEDLFQDTFIKVITTLKEGKYNEEGKFLPWVIRIAHNLIIDHFRYSNRYKVLKDTAIGEEDFSIFDLFSSSELNIEESLSKEQLIIDLKNLVDLLPEEQREVITLKIYKNLSFKEISEDTGVSINTALGRMRYALINLRKLIEQKNISLI